MSLGVARMYVFLLEEVHVNKLNPKSELMTFLGYLQGTKGYLFIRGPNNVLFTAVQALFDETLFPKCLDICCPRYTPVAPVNAQGEYNIPLEDNENGNHRGAPFASAPPGRFVLYQAPPHGPLPKDQGKGQNPNPPVPPEPTPPRLTPSESESDDFYVPKTPSLRSSSRDLDSSHEFINPNPGPHDKLYDKELVTYGNPDGSPLNIRYNYTRHGRQLSWDWHNPTTEQQFNLAAPIQEWYDRAGCPDLDDTVFEEFL